MESASNQIKPHSRLMRLLLQSTVAALLITLKSAAIAQVTDAPPSCGRTTRLSAGVDVATGWAWAAWICPAPSRTARRYREWGAVVVDMRSGPPAVADVYKSCMQGACNYALGLSLRTVNLTDPKAAGAWKAARDYITAWQPTNVAVSDGKTVCACDVRHTGMDTDAIWTCPTAAAPSGPDVKCRAQ